MSADPRQCPSRLRRTLAGVFVAAMLAYLPALENGFLHWDDYTYVYRNPYMGPLDITALRWALTTTYFSYWHPLTWLSHLLDYALWGMDPRMHHLTNMVLHGLNCMVVFAFTVLVLGAAQHSPRSPAGGVRLVGAFQQPGLAAGATVAALLFAVHPQHVEVVAWVSERKELLSTLFYLLALCVYLVYGSTPGPARRRTLLLTTGLLFLLALMSKPMAVTLPVALLLLDIYPLRRLTGQVHLPRVLAEKAPFLLASACVIYVTIVSQEHAGAIKSLGELGLPARVANALNNMVFYLQKLLVPRDLAAFYPFPDFVRQWSWRTAVSPGVFLLVTLVCGWAARCGRPAWAVLWIGYLVTLAPVVGLIHSGPQAAADRYAYLPTIGFYVLAGGAAARVSGIAAGRLTTATRVLLCVVMLTLVFTLAGATTRRIAIFRDDLTLWNSVVSRFPDASTLAYNNLANALFERGDDRAALAHYLKAIEIEPLNRAAYDNILAVVSGDGTPARALDLLEGLAERYPQSALPWQTLAKYQTRRGNHAEALAHLRRASMIEPDAPSVYYEMGRIALAEHRYDDAGPDFERALRLAPDYVDAMLDLAAVSRHGGRTHTAIGLYAKAMDVAPEDVRAYRRLGKLLVELQDYATAADVYRLLLHVARHDPQVYLILARLYEQTAHGAAVEDILTRGVEANPASIVLHQRLAEHYAATGRPARAQKHRRRAAGLEAATASGKLDLQRP